MNDHAATFDTAGASIRTGVSISTLEKWRVAGSGPPYFKLGRLVRYDGTDLSLWLARHRVQSTSERVAR